MKKWFGLSLLGLGMLVATPTARADWYGGGERSIVYRPIASVRAGVGWPWFLGGAVSFKFLQPLELEGGFDTDLTGGSIFGRLGFSLGLHDTRGVLGTGWDIDVLFFGGYRYLMKDFQRSGEAHGATLSAALNATYWFASHFGLQAQLTAGAGYWFLQQNTQRTDFFPDVSLTVGFAF